MRRVLACATASLLLAGCGDSGDGDKAATTDTVAVAPGTARVVRLASQLVKGGGSGERVVFTSMLFRQDGKAAIGRSQGSCERTSPGAGEVFNCLFVFILPEGSIYAQGLASVNGPSSGIVTGGTRAYHDLRGDYAYTATGRARVSLQLRLKP